MFATTLDVRVTSTTTIFPSSPINDPKSTPLSILDNTSANFARCAAIWYYPPSINPLIPSHLQISLSQTLNSYRPWCGRLSYTLPPEPKGTQNKRYQRIWVTYNTPNDIGIPFTTATSPHSLSDFLPNVDVRRHEKKASDGVQLPSASLLPDTKLAISKDRDAPNVVIQFTTFTCGSSAVGISITHCLSDALSLSQFATDWARTSRALLTGATPASLSPVFDPKLLNSHAAGDIDSFPDPEILKKARALPQHRYDWYKADPNQAWRPNLPEDFDASLGELSPSDPIPWHQWDTKATVSHRLIHFSKEEIIAIYNAILTSSSPASKSTTIISKHDALLAHLWSRIIAARNLPTGTTSYLDMTFGLRARVSPPLPDSFLGSPITHAAIPSTNLVQGESEDAGTLARRIRQYLARFASQEIGWILHDRASEVAPQRLWHACLGREHVLLTTWVHSGVHDVEFVEGVAPIYVEAVVYFPLSLLSFRC